MPYNGESVMDRVVEVDSGSAQGHYVYSMGCIDIVLFRKGQSEVHVSLDCGQVDNVMLGVSLTGHPSRYMYSKYTASLVKCFHLACVPE